MQRELTEKATLGEFHLSGRNNILTVAIGTPEYPGCVKGCG